MPALAGGPLVLFVGEQVVEAGGAARFCALRRWRRRSVGCWCVFDSDEDDESDGFGAAMRRS
eukprot:2297261-Lingulodinium_polyedra.AAC.1